MAAISQLLTVVNGAVTEGLNKSKEAKIYGTASGSIASPYLESKGIKELHGARVNEKNRTTIIRLFDKKFNHVSNQYIDKDGVDKRYTAGIGVKGLFALIMPSLTSSICLRVFICEGFATGCSIFEALDGKEIVLCALSANNLPPVVKSAQEMHPTAKIVIAADDDSVEKEKGKPYSLAGLEWSLRSGVAFIMPEWPKDRKGGTDFNDLAQLIPREELAAQLMTEVKPLEGEELLKAHERVCL